MINATSNNVMGAVSNNRTCRKQICRYHKQFNIALVSFVVYDPIFVVSFVYYRVWHCINPVRSLFISMGRNFSNRLAMMDVNNL